MKSYAQHSTQHYSLHLLSPIFQQLCTACQAVLWSTFASPHSTARTKISKKNYIQHSAGHGIEPAPRTTSQTTNFHDRARSHLLWKKCTGLPQVTQTVTSCLSCLMTEPLSWLSYVLFELFNCELPLDYSTV